jgi:MFS family permease
VLPPFAGFFAFGVFWGAWAAVLPAIKAGAGATDAQLGVALLCVAAGALTAMLVTGALADRFGPRATAGAFAGFAAAVCVPAFTRSVVALALSLLLLGALSGAVDVTINGAVASLERERGRSLMNQAHALFPLGSLAGAGAAAIARGAGVSAEAILVTVALLLLGVGLANLLGDHPRVVAGATARFRLVRARALVVLGAVCALGFMIENGLESWSAVQLSDTLGTGPAVSGLGPAAFAAAMIAGRLVMARIAGRVTGRLLAAAALLSAAGLIVVAVAGSPAAALAGVAVAGFGVAGVAPTVLGVGGRIAPEGERSAAIATVTTVSYFGFLVGPVLVGGVAGAVGLRGGLAALAVVALLLAALVGRVAMLRGRVAVEA